MPTDDDRVARGLVGLGIVGATVPLTPAALDETMLVKIVLVVAIVAVLAAWTLAGAFAHQRVTLLSGAPAVALSALAAVVLAAAAWSSYPSLSLAGSYERYSGAIGYVAYAGLALAVARWFGPGRADRVVAWILAAASGVIAYGLLQMADLDPVSWRGRFGDDVIAQFGNPDFVSGYLGIVLPLAVWAAAWSGWSRPPRLVAAVLAVAGTVVLVGAGAVQGFVTAGVGLLVLAVAGGAAAASRPGPILAGGGALLVGGLTVVLAGLGGVGPAVGLWELSTASSRRYLWSAALEMIRAEPVTGVGLDLYGRYYHAFRPVDEAIRRDLEETADAAHNVALQLASGGGVPVLVAWLGLAVVVLVALVAGWRRGDVAGRRLVAALGAAYAGYHTQALVSLDVPPLAATHFVLVGAIAATAGMAEVRRIGAGPATARGTRRVWITVGLAGPVLVILGVVLWADRLAGTAEAAARGGDPEAGRTAIEDAVGLAPWQPAYHFEQARLLAEAGQLEAALAAMDEVIRRDPRDLAAWISRGRLTTALDRPLAAVEAYREARAIAPNSPALAVEYAEALVAVDQLGLARSVLIDVLEIAPGYAPARDLLDGL